METDIQQLRWAVVELQRRLSNVVRIGTVADLDVTAARVRVQYDEASDGTPAVTRWLQWGVRRAGPDRTWWAPEVGEQVVVLSPSGDLSQGIVVCSLWQNAYPANGSDADVSRIDWSDGSWAEHDRGTGRVVVRATGDLVGEAGGVATLESPTRVEVNAPQINLNGNVSAYALGLTGGGGLPGNAVIAGSVTATGDVTGGGVSLESHRHGGVERGGGSTDEPT